MVTSSLRARNAAIALIWLASLIAGRAHAEPHPRWEEALQSFDYVWTQAPETMKLECGRYDGRKTVFAIGVTFEQTPPR